MQRGTSIPQPMHVGRGLGGAHCRAASYINSIQVCLGDIIDDKRAGCRFAGDGSCTMHLA